MAVRTVEVAFLGTTRELEAALRRAGIVAEVEGRRIGESFDAGTSRAASGLHKLSSLGASWGLPFSGALDNIARKFDEASTKSAKFTEAMAAAGRLTLTAGLGGFAAAAYEGVKGAATLQQSMERLHTQAGATQAEVRRMTSAVGDMAGKVGIGPNELAQGLYHVESAGLRGAKALGVLQVAAEGAKVGGANLTDVTNALDAAVVSGIKGVQNYGQAMGALNATVGAGDMTMQDLADALSTGVLAPMKTYGLTLRDVGAALAVFGDNNIRGQDAATKLTAAVRIMAAPSTAAAKALGSIHLSTLQLAQDMRSGGLIKALEDLRQHLRASGADANQQGLIIARAFGGKQSTGVQVLLGQLDRLREKYGQIGQGANQFSEDVARTQHTLVQQLARLNATVKALADAFGTFLIPRLEAVAHVVSQVVGWFERHKFAAEALAGVISGVLATAIAAFAFQKAVALVNATKNMVGGLVKLADTFGLLPKAAGAATVATATAERTLAGDVQMTATKLGTANAAAGASFGKVPEGATTAEAKLAPAEAAMVGTVTEADAEIETANAAAGASFLKLLGPIGLALGAIQAYNLAASNPGAAGAAAVSGLQSASGGALSQGQLTNLLASTGAIGATGKHGLYPWSQDNTRLIQEADQALKEFASSGNAQLLQRIIDKAEALKRAWPQDASALNTLVGVMHRAMSEAATSVSLPGASASQDQVASTMMRTFLAAGLSRAGASALIGNAMQESSLNPAAQGGGLFQWSDPKRNAALWSWTRARGLNAETATGASMFAVHELQTQYPALWQMLVAGNASPNELALAVSNIYEQPRADAANNPARERYAQEAYGSSSGSFSTAAIYGSSHHRARAVRELLYANPLPGLLSVGRTDMGVDLSARPGSPVDAIGKGIVTSILQNWYKGQPLVEEKLTAGPQAGRYAYYAEQLTPGVHVGQQLAAGQQIGTVAASGTGLELGFGAPGGRTLAQATTGYVEGHPTPAGEAFRRFLASIGTHGIYTTRGGTAGGGGGVYTLGQLIQQYLAGLTREADTLLQQFGQIEQAGTARTISRALGFSTGGTITTRVPYPSLGTGGGGGAIVGGPGGGPLMRTIHESVGALLHKQIEALPEGASFHQIDTALMGTVTRATAGSQQTQHLNTLVAQLRATHQAALERLANQLVAAHKAALATLAQELYAQQVLKDGELLNLQATEMKDRTTLQQNLNAALLNIAKAEQQKLNDAAAAQVSYVRDMTQLVSDRFAAAAQAIQDATQLMADASNRVVQGIQDRTRIQVDTFGERGLYGLNLVAQKLQVNADILKMQYDGQIAAAQQQLDATKANWNAQVNQAKIALDQTAVQQHQLVALAQQQYDTVAVQQAIKLAAAQQHMDAVTLHEDASVLGPAQMAMDLGAVLPKHQQDVLNAALRRAEGEAGKAEAIAARQFSGVQAQANRALQSAQGLLDQTTSTANQMIANAQATLATVTGQASMATAAAAQNLQSVQDTAAQAQATAQSLIDITRARAQTQFAGSGAVVNIYGLPADNAAAIGSAVDWVARTQLQTV